MAATKIVLVGLLMISVFFVGLAPVAADDGCTPSGDPGYCVSTRAGSTLFTETFIAGTPDAQPIAEILTVRIHYQDPVSGQQTHQDYNCFRMGALYPCVGETIDRTPLYSESEIGTPVEVRVYELTISWCIVASPVENCNGGTGIYSVQVAGVHIDPEG